MRRAAAADAALDGSLDMQILETEIACLEWQRLRRLKFPPKTSEVNFP